MTFYFWRCRIQGSFNNRPTPAVADKHMMCVNLTWLGTNILWLQLELYSSVLGEVGQIPSFVYFCLLIDQIVDTLHL